MSQTAKARSTTAGQKEAETEGSNVIGTRSDGEAVIVTDRDPNMGATPSDDVGGLLFLEPFEAAAKVNAVAWHGVLAVSQEVLEFGGTCVREYFDACTAFVGCRTLGDALEVQRDVTERATEQYLDEAKKLTELAATLASDGWGHLEEATNLSVRHVGRW